MCRMRVDRKATCLLVSSPREGRRAREGGREGVMRSEGR